MEFENGNALHVVLFGTFNESKYFLGEFKNAFDLIGFNANIIAYAREGITAFVSSLQNKSYFIDPQFHAFQQRPEKVKMKKSGQTLPTLKNSIKSLAEIYGEPVNSIVGISSIEINLSDDNIRLLSRNILEFQYNYIKQCAENKPDITEFLEFSGSLNQLRPKFLVAPYYYLEPDDFNREIENNIKFIDESANIITNDRSYQNIPLFAELVLHRDILLNKEWSDLLVKYYTNKPIQGILLWIDSYSEIENIKLDYLKKYISFLQAVNALGIPIISLHGSYFSTMLSSRGASLLAGVGHGIEYGETRPVVPVGGGVPAAKYYFPNFYKRVDFNPDAQNVLLETRWDQSRSIYLDRVCKCKLCTEIISDDVMSSFDEYGKTKISEKNGKTYPTAATMDKCRRHYLYNKSIEYDNCKNMDLNSILNDLKRKMVIAASIKTHPFIHLEKWASAIETILNNR